MMASVFPLYFPQFLFLKLTASILTLTASSFEAYSSFFEAYCFFFLTLTASFLRLQLPFLRLTACRQVAYWYMLLDATLQLSKKLALSIKLITCSVDVSESDGHLAGEVADLHDIDAMRGQKESGCTGRDGVGADESAEDSEDFHLRGMVAGDLHLSRS